MLLITFLQDQMIDTTVLPEKKKGHYLLNHSLPDLTEDIAVDGVDNQWRITSGEQYSVIRYDEAGNGEELPYAELEDEDTVVLRVGEKEHILIVGTVRDERTRFTKLCFRDPCAEENIIRIGKKTDNDIVLNDGYISGHHAVLIKRGQQWYVYDEKSINGTFVNHCRIEHGKEYPLQIGDVVLLVGYQFVICADLVAANIDPNTALRSDRLRLVRFPAFDRDHMKRPETVPERFYRTTEIAEKPVSFEPLELLPPEQSPKKEQQSILLSMGSAVTMSAASVLVAGYNGVAAYYRDTNFSYIVPSFIMAGSMILSAMVWPIIIRKNRAKAEKRAEAERVRNYQEYIMELRDRANVMRDTERAYLRRKYFTIEECLRRVISKDRELWSKSILDPEFMRISLGEGTLPSTIEVKNSDSRDAFFKDDLRYDMMQFAREERVLEHVPITISFNDGAICGISGEKEEALELIREIVVQLTALYSYDELKLIFVFDEKETELWEYAKWLPHTWNDEGTFRYIASNADEMKELSAQLQKEIDDRMTHPEEQHPRILMIASDKKKVDGLDLMQILVRERKKLGFSLLTSFGSYNYNYSERIIEVEDHKARLYDRIENTVTDLVPYRVSSPELDQSLSFERYLNSIANIRLDIATEKSQLPKMVTFLDMFQVSKVEHLNILSRWVENNPIKSLKTEIGVGTSGDRFYIDMHEKFHGPHGLIAGTTGSGKSESIITMILSLAVNYSPEEVAFVIVDYKGGGLADAFDDSREEEVDGQLTKVRYKLPHVVGTVTNLDGAMIERARISIETELKRRQHLFKKARRVSNDGTMDIYKYQQLRREGADLDVLPHLFIVCDEFAELKADRGDFMDLLVSAARIGRSLGIHLVLATQKPDSVVSPQIWSNSRFKICLKVQGKEDSKAVIHCPDAAEISTTGRFFFQVGYNEVFSQGQSAWCGADYIPSDEFVKKDIESLEVISNTGAVLYEKKRKEKKAPTAGSGRTVSQLIAVRDHLIEVAKGLEVDPLWLDPIPAKLSLRDLYQEAGRQDRPKGRYVPIAPIIGKRDDLYERVQGIMNVPFSERGNLAVFGAAGSGLDMFFISLLYSLIYGYSSEDVAIYMLDFDSGFLKAFQKAPHVGDVVTSEEQEEVKAILKGVHDEIVRRSKVFSDYRGEYTEYCKYSDGEKLPQIILMLNNYTEFMEKFDSEDQQTLVYIAREGIKRGVFLVVGSGSVNMNNRLRQYIQQTYMLRMNDENDYVALLGRTGGITPSNCEGNGIVKENNVTYKFQVAGIFDVVPEEEDDSLLPVNDTGKEVKELCERAAEENPVKAASLKPKKLSFEDVVNGEITIGHIPLGEEEGEVVDYDFSDKYLTFVAGLDEDQLTSYAAYLAKMLAKDPSIEVMALDVTGKLADPQGGYQCFSTVEELDQFNKRYKADAEARCAMLVKQPDGSYVIGGDVKHVYVIINSFQDVAKFDKLNVTFANLKSIMLELPEIHYHYIILDTPDKMNAERGAFIHIIKNVEDISKIENMDVENNREWFDASGIWIGDGFGHSSFFDTTNTRPHLLKGDGAVIQNRKFIKKFTLFG